MILVDTSVWVDHLRRGEPALARLLELGHVLIHPFVIGEVALSNLRQRDIILDTLQSLAAAPAAGETEVLAFIAANELAGSGIGYVDAHLLASARLAPGTSLWTRDNRLKTVAARLGMLAEAV